MSVSKYQEEFKEFFYSLFVGGERESHLHNAMDLICKRLSKNPISMLVNKATPLELGLDITQDDMILGDFLPFFEMYHTGIQVKPIAPTTFHQLGEQYEKRQEKLGESQKNTFKESTAVNKMEDLLKWIEEAKKKQPDLFNVKDLTVDKLRERLISSFAKAGTQGDLLDYVGFLTREKSLFVTDVPLLGDKGKITKFTPLHFSDTLVEGDKFAQRSVLFSLIMFVPKEGTGSDDAFFYLIVHRHNEECQTEPVAFWPYWSKAYERKKNKESEEKVPCLELQSLACYKKDSWKRGDGISYKATIDPLVASLLFPQVITDFAQPKVKQYGVLLQAKSSLKEFLVYAEMNDFDEYKHHKDFFIRLTKYLMNKQAQRNKKDIILSAEGAQKTKTAVKDHADLMLNKMLAKRKKREEEQEEEKQGPSGATVDDAIELNSQSEYATYKRLKKNQEDTESMLSEVEDALSQEDQQDKPASKLTTVLSGMPRMATAAGSTSTTSTKSQGAGQISSAAKKREQKEQVKKEKVESKSKAGRNK